MIKPLSDFEDIKGIEIASELLFPIIKMIRDPKNEGLEYSDNIMQMFTEFTRNNPEEMMQIFAILSEKKPEDYHCTADEAMLNLLALANDGIFVNLFTTQQRQKAVKSSVAASESTGE